MAVTFEKRPHNLLPGVEVVDILVNGVAVATIAPQSDGDGIKLTSAHFAGDLAQKVAYECLQAYGGYGYMEEYDIARFARDVRLITIGGGTSEVMKEIIAKRMGLMERG